MQLLRLKCEAYSTLSDTDENSDAETRLKERMNEEGVPPPKQDVLAPASLYLTAIIEYVHILYFIQSYCADVLSSGPYASESGLSLGRCS
jgi:hypothetical protein